MAPGLTVYCCNDFRTQQAACDEAARRAAAQGPCVRVALTDDAATRTRLRLADTGDPNLGTPVQTLDCWVADRWSLYGDGRSIVTPAQRWAAVEKTLLDCELAHLNRAARGTATVLADVAARGAGAPALENASSTDGRLAGTERDLVAAYRAYRALLDEHGLVEPGAVCALLPAALGGAGWAHLVLDGLPSDLTPAQATLVAEAAAHRGVTVVAPVSDRPAHEAARHVLALIVSAAQGLSVAVAHFDARELVREGVSAAPASPELASVARRLFAPQSGAPVEPHGDVRACLPAGPYAEPRLVAREISRLRAGGIAARDIFVAAPQPLDWARRLAGSLAEDPNGPCACLVRGGEPVGLTALGSLLSALVQLADAERGEPGAPVPALVCAASDAARSPLSGIRTGAALRLDRTWRQHRATSASDLLNDLAQAARDQAERDRADAAEETAQVASTPAGPSDPTSDTSPAPSLADPAPLERAIAAVRAQDAEAAIAALATAVPFDDRASQAAAATLAERARERADFSAAPLTCASLASLMGGCQVSSTQLFVPANGIAAQENARVLDANPNAVHVGTIDDLEGRRFAAVIVCELTAGAYSVANRPEPQGPLWEKLGLPRSTPALSLRRRQLGTAVEAADRALVVERPLQDAEGKELRPSALFEELVDCYRADPTDVASLNKATGLPRDGSIPCSTGGEERFAELVPPVTYAPATRPVPATSLLLRDPDLRGLLVHEGQLWSPSSLEAYLNCPARWLFERRIPGDAPDAAFGPLETGTFCHRVLQEFHTALPQTTGLARIEPATEPTVWQGLLDSCFDRVLADQGEGDHPLVPINRLEQGKVEVLRRNLHRCVAGEARLPAGFVPRLHEWTFGDGAQDGRGTAPVPYGGVLLHGTVDRIDLDGQGRALIVDYKGSVSDDLHGLPRAKRGQDPSEVDPLPFHSQALMYATAVQRSGLAAQTVAALYVSYQDERARGFADASLLAAFEQAGPYLDARNVAPLQTGGVSGFQVLLDTVEGEVAEAMDRLRDGDVAPRPRFGTSSCSYCTVSGCSKRKA